MSSAEASVGASVAELMGELPVAAPAAERAPDTFDEAYEQYFDFVWRNTRRLGVPESQVDDAVQEVFLVVHRKMLLGGASPTRAWMFGILVRVASEHRRSNRRKSTLARAADPPVDPDQIALEAEHDEPAAHAEAARVVQRLLDGLDDDKRTVFVLSELEQMTAPEIAAATGTNLNTVYARLRAARKEFDQAVQRLRARDGWREAR